LEDTLAIKISDALFFKPAFDVFVVVQPERWFWRLLDSCIVLVQLQASSSQTVAVNLGILLSQTCSLDIPHCDFSEVFRTGRKGEASCGWNRCVLLFSISDSVPLLAPSSPTGIIVCPHRHVWLLRGGADVYQLSIKAYNGCDQDAMAE
jgi:hypothetical protein